MIRLVKGPPGSGKSYVAVNRFFREWLENSGRPIYTNLPLVKGKDGIYELVRQITRNHARQKAMCDRIHEIKAGLEVVPEWTNPETGEVIPSQERCRLREFWYFTPLGSVIFLDELAEIYDAKGRGERGAPETFATYMRLHRHLGDDFYGFAQHQKDIVAQFRRLVGELISVENSTKRNMFEWWALRGLKWPIQFFSVRTYIGSEVMDLVNVEQSSATTQESYVVWPNKAGFRTYRSFSRVSQLAFKGELSDKAETSDVNQPFFVRYGGFVRQLPLLGSLLIFVVMGIWMFHRGVNWLLHPQDSLTTWYGSPISTPATNSGSAALTASLAVPGGTRKAAGTNFKTSVLAGAPVQGPVAGELPERLLLVTPNRLSTTRGDYEVGDSLAGHRVARFLLDGFVSNDGGAHRWGVVFPRRQGGGVGSGGGDSGTLASVGADAGTRGQSGGVRPVAGE